MAVQINVAANQAALTASIQAGVQAYNQRFAQNNQINLSINQRGFSQPLGRITGDVKDFEAALAASNARVIAFGASTAVLGGVIRSFKELANVTIEVEKNLADINRVFGLTTSQLQKFSTDLFNVTKLTASSFDDASKAALEFSRQGLKAEDTLQRTKDALTLTRLAGISTANAVDALTSTVNGFAATGISTTQILNKLVAVEQDYAVGAGDLAEALSRTGQAAQEAGVSLDQLNALVTSAQQSTARGGAVIGNALKTIFTRLQRTDTLDQLEAFNISVRDVQGNILPAVQILQNFAGAYKGLADAQRAQLSEQVAGVYQVNILKAIVNDLNKSQGTYAGALQRGAAATNEAEVATAKLNQTLDALLKQTATSTQQLANNIGKVTFEPLAKYGTEQLKSFIESLNEVLEGEGVGSTFANGLLKGIRNVIAGPGAIAAFFTLFKLIQNSFTYLSQALPQIAGITTETQNRKNIEQSILQIMQQQGPVSQALAGNMGNQAAQAQLLLQVARQQTAEYQMQTTLAKQLAVQLAGQGVRVKGAGGLQVTRAGGYIPNATKMAEVVGAQAGGYTPGRVVSSPVGGVMNTAEDIKYIPGFAQPFINPPAGSKAGRAHRQNAINRTGVDPYMYGGFIPNFAKKIANQFAIGRAFEQSVGIDIGVPPAWNEAIDFKEVLEKPVSKNFNPKLYQLNTFADAHSGLGHKSSENISKVINHLGQNYYSYLPRQGSKTKRLKLDDKTSIISKPDLLGDLFIRPRYTEIIGEGYDNPTKESTSSISSLNDTAKKTLSNGVSESDFKRIEKRKIKMQFAQDKVYNSGFIPNFAPPTSAIRVPWFKKFGNPAFDAIQPALGISKASDTETFRQINFKSTAEGADERGDNNIFAPLFEDFAFKAMQLVSQQDVKDDLIRGYVLQPRTNQKQSAFDAALKEAGVGIEYKGYPKKNLTGSITGELTRKYETLSKTNPAAAAKLKELIIAFNEVGHENQITSELGKKLFSPLAGVSYSQMVKNSPDLVKGLSVETDSLLNSYVKNPAFLAMAAANGFIPNFASRSEMIRDLIRFNLESTPDVKDKNIFGSKTTLFRGVRNKGERYSSQFGRDIFEQSRNYSKTENDIDYFRDTDINKIANDHIKEKKLLPFVSASMDEDIAKYFARGRRDDNFLGEGKVGSKTIKNSRIFSAESIRKFTNKYGQEALKQLMMEHSTWGSFGSGKGIAMNFQSFSDKKGFEGTDFAKEISFLSKGFVPNFADFIDVDTLTKNSVHYSGDLMKLIKDIESSIGRNLSSGELRFLSSPKTDLSKLNDPKILNRFINSERKGGFAGFAKGFLPNFNSIKGRNSFQKNWLIETAKKRNLNLNDPNVFSKLGAEFAKTYPSDQGMFGFSKGFIPNFAYKQAVMGLEESMSGNKAIFDTKPFPHIRNSSQPTFSSAIADHGGLGNALSDSMRGQKAAGLMSGGLIPNFAAFGPSYSYMPSGTPSGSSAYYPSGNPNASQRVSPIYAPQQSNVSGRAGNSIFNNDDIEKATQGFVDTVQKADAKLSIFERVFGGRNKLIDSGLSKLEKTLSNNGVTGQALSDAMDKARKTISTEQSKFAKNLSSASTAISIAGPMIAGFAEQIAFGDKKRTDLTSTERGFQSALSTGLSAVSTGAGIGASFGPLGAGIGAAAGALVGLTSALNATTLSAEELSQLNQEQVQKSQASISAASSYIETQKSLTQMIASGASSSDIENASKKLSDNFKQIEDVKLQEIFNATGGDVKKMTEELQKYSNEVTRRSAFIKGVTENSDIKTTSQSLSAGIVKENRKQVIEGFRKASEFQRNELNYEQALKSADYGSGRKKEEGGKTLKEIIDEAEKYRKKNIGFGVEAFVPKLLEIGGLSKEDPQYESEYKNAIKKFKSLPPEKLKEIADNLEKADLVSGVGASINKLNNVATKSFNQIFLEIEQQIAKSAFDIALNFEKDSGSRKIQSAVLDFSMNFQDNLNSFLLNNLPDARKFDFTTATAGQKAQMLLQKSQQDYDKAIADQANERSIFLNKSSKDLTAAFKSSFLPSQKSAEFFKKNIFSQLQAGTFRGGEGSAKSLAEQMRNEAFAQTKEIASKGGFNLNTLEDVDTVLKQVTDKMESVSTLSGTASDEYKKLEIVLQSIQELQKQTALYTNDNDVKRLQGLIDESVREKELFDIKQANAKKELEINKQLSEAKIAADKQIATEKARVDKENLMRMESMKDLSANIGNALEISKARSAANVNALQRRLDDQRETFGMGRSQISERKFGIQADILKEQRKAEDAAINAEIQQRVLEMAAEQENTAATLKLNDTIMTLIETQLRGELGGTGKIEEINSLVNMAGYSEKQINDQFGPQSFEKYQAYKRIQESRIASAASNTGYNTSDFSSRMQAVGFNDKMTQAEQSKFLEQEETKAREAGNVLLAGTIKRYKDQIEAKKEALKITREDIDEQIKLNAQIERVNNTFAGRFRKGWGNLRSEADDLILNLGENLPKMFADGMVDGIKAAIRESDNLGDALMGVASKFLDSISTTLMQASIYGLLGSVGVPNLPTAGKQKGGYIRAQSGMYISGTGSGDKYPALLENGEYVLNRKAVMAMGGPAALDTLNFSAAPRFAAGGSFGNNFSDISSMESNMTTYGLEQSQLYNELRDSERQKQQEAIRKRQQRKAERNAMIGSIIAAVATAAIAAGVSNVASNVKATNAQKLSAKVQATGGAGMTNSEMGKLASYQKSGLLGKNFEYIGGTPQTGFASIFSGPTIGKTWYQKAGSSITKPFGRRQAGGYIGSRLSDTIPTYATGGLVDMPIVKRYAVGGNVSAQRINNGAGNNSTVNNNTSASNSFNFNTTVQRDGKIEIGSNMTSYSQQDVELSQSLNTKVYEVVLDTIRKEKRFGGSLAGTRNA